MVPHLYGLCSERWAEEPSMCVAKSPLPEPNSLSCPWLLFGVFQPESEMKHFGKFDYWFVGHTEAWVASEGTDAQPQWPWHLLLVLVISLVTHCTGDTGIPFFHQHSIHCFPAPPQPNCGGMLWEALLCESECCLLAGQGEFYHTLWPCDVATGCAASARHLPALR